MSGIEINGLTKRYKDVVAVDGLTLSIQEGELFGLLGINGAGKTTTVKMLCGLTQPTGGEASVLGFPIGSKEARAVVAVSPQETAIAPTLSVRENLIFIARAYLLSKEEAIRKSDEVATLLGLSEVMDKKSAKLSGGYKRRLSIAMALITSPKVLFLDEPTLGLDVIARSELWDLIKGFKGKITTVLTSHYMEEVESLCDRVAIMRNGKLLVVGTAEEIMEASGAATFEKAFVSIVKEGL